MSIVMTLKQALSGLLANKIRTFLMMIGVIIGIAALISIVAVGQGAKAKVVKSADKMWGANPIMVTASAGGPNAGPHFGMGVGVGSQTLTMEDLQAIEKEVPNVRKASPGLFKSDVQVKYREQAKMTGVWGITPEFREYRSWDVESGEYISDDDVRSSSRVALIGETVARELFGDEDPVGARIMIDNVSFKVKGVLMPRGTNPGGMDIDDRVMIPITTFSRRLYNVDYLSNIVVHLKDISRMDETAAAITALLRDRHQIVPPKQEDFGVRTPSGVVQTFAGTSQTLTLFLGIVSGIALLVGGLVIMNIMLISIIERTREIGIRRALGARQKDILNQFLAEAVMVTLTGGLIGVLAGVSVAKALSVMKSMPTVVSWQAIVLAVVFSVVVGIVFGVQPARRAAHMNPVEALRGK
ncbi:MAG: ABC transporter permease [Armatimonadota bacterium]